MTIKLLSFDLDDTLWPVFPTLKAAELKTYDWLQEEAPALTERYSLRDIASYRVDLFRDNPELQNQIGELRRRSIAELAMQAGMSGGDAALLADRAFDLHYELRQQVTPFPQVRETLARLSQDYQIVAITNGNADIFATELGEFFLFSISAESEGVSKPERKIFSKARQRAEQVTGESLSAESVLHIGDSLLHDVQGARQAGFRAVWLQHHTLVAPEERHRYELKDSESPLSYPQSSELHEGELLRADAEISDLAELPGVLEQLR